MFSQKFCKHSPIILDPPLDIPCLFEISGVLQKNFGGFAAIRHLFDPSTTCSRPENLRCSRQHYNLYKADGAYQFQYGAVILGGHLCGAGITHYWGHQGDPPCIQSYRPKASRRAEVIQVDVKVDTEYSEGRCVWGILRPIRPSPHCSFPALWEALPLMLRPIDYDCDAHHDRYSDDDELQMAKIRGQEVAQYGQIRTPCRANNKQKNTIVK